MIEISLSETEKREANDAYADPCGWIYERDKQQARANRLAQDLVRVIEWAGSDDRDAAPLREALRRLFEGDRLAARDFKRVSRAISG